MMAHWRVREIAEPERWSARKLAAASGLAYNTVWGMWANRSKRADLESLEAIARVLKVTPGDLIGPGDGAQVDDSSPKVEEDVPDE